MTETHRPRRLATLALLLLAAGLAACSSAEYPNSIFTRHTDTNKDVGDLFNRLFLFGTIVFVLVEALLLYVIVRFRRKPNHPEPEHVHGNTTLEVLWTAIPAVILIFIAVPTVRTIFRTQAKARPDALTIEVIGHQWWWEFRYPQYENVTTANEVYMPAGRTVNFELKTADVIHSFWIPALSGKRDVMPNHTNFIWFTPDSALGAQVWNGHCAEYCGESHANMKFRAYTVTPAQFDSWVRGQQQVAAFGATAPAAPAAAPGAATPAAAGQAAAGAALTSQASVTPGPNQPAGSNPVPPDAAARAQNSTSAAGSPPPAMTQPGAPAAAAGYVFPRDSMPLHTRPTTPVPASLRVNTALKGDPARGQQQFISCIGCHKIAGNPLAQGVVGPNLTHVGSRNTIAGGLFPNDTEHLARWIKNAPLMKPGVSMQVFGLNEVHPVTKVTVTKALGGLTDQQIMDIVAYLQALK